MRHHIESFNYLLEDGLQRAVEGIRPQELVDPHGRWVVLALEAASIGLPTADMKNVHAKSVQVFPSEVGVAIAQGVGHFYCNCVTPYRKSAVSGIVPCCAVSGIVPCCAVSGIVPCCVVSGIVPCCAVSGIVPCCAVSGIVPCCAVSGIVPCCVVSGIVPCCAVSGIVPCCVVSGIVPCCAVSGIVPCCAVSQELQHVQSQAEHYCPLGAGWLARGRDHRSDWTGFHHGQGW